MTKVPRRLGEILVEKGIITESQLNAALKEQAEGQVFLGDLLLKKKQIKESDLLEALSEQFDIPLINLKVHPIDWNYVKGFTSSLILDHKCLPLAEDESSRTFAIVNPLDAWAIKKAEEESKDYRVKLVLVTKNDMEEAISKYKDFMRGDISKKLE